MTAGTDKEEAEQFGLAAPKVQSHLEGRQIRKVIVVPGMVLTNTEITTISHNLKQFKNAPGQFSLKVYSC